MTVHRTRRRPWENRAGWWGILWWSLAAAALALAATVAVFVPRGGDAGWSALVGGGVVLLLSAVTGATTALVWDRAREAALPLSVGAFVVKLVVYMLLLTVVPRPAWLEALPAGVGALVVLLVWQAAEVLVFSRTRRSIYAD